MNTTLIRWTRTAVACLLLAIPTYASAQTDEAAAPPPPEYPTTVWQALLHGGGGSFILRADGQQILALPETAFYIEAQDSRRNRYMPIVGGLVNALSALEPIAGSVSELWTIDGQSTLFGRGELSRNEIITSFQGYGWILIGDEGHLQHLRQPLDEADETMIRDSIEDHRQQLEAQKMQLAEWREAAENGDEEARQMLALRGSMEAEETQDFQEFEDYIRSEQEERKWKVVPGDNGWFSLIGPWSQPTAFALEQPSEEDMAEFRPFPLSVFLEESPEDLVSLAMIFPSREDPNPSADSNEDEEKDPRQARLENELNELHKEQMALMGGRGDDILDRIGNMLLRINEIDGGFDLDLTAEIPGNPRDSFTAEAVQMGLGFLRMSVVSQSPELALELLDTTVSVSGDQVRARTNISHATLMDLLHRNAAKQQRLEEIMERMEELQMELAALHQAEAG